MEIEVRFSGKGLRRGGWGGGTYEEHGGADDEQPQKIGAFVGVRVLFEQAGVAHLFADEKRMTGQGRWGAVSAGALELAWGGTKTHDEEEMDEKLDRERSKVDEGRDRTPELEKMRKMESARLERVRRASSAASWQLPGGLLQGTYL